MATTTHSDFHADTEGLEVAKAFADRVRGKTILVTGVNRNGIGFTTSRAFASQAPANIIIAGRSVEKVEESISALKADYPDVNYRVLQIDLSDQQSVRDAAARVLAWADVPAIDILINSAGIMGLSERTLNKDGMEMHFATNHIGHWLFTCLVMPKLIRAAQNSPRGATRVVNVTSASPTRSGMRWSDMNFDKKNKTLPEAEQPDYAFMKGWGYIDAQEASYIPLDGYNRSKVANVLFGIGANKRLLEKHGIFTTAVHPGVIKTELGRYFELRTLDHVKDMADKGIFRYKSLDAGASTSVVAALDPRVAQGVGETKNGSENWGAYFEDCQISGSARAESVSSSEAERLWELSEKLVKQTFAW